MSPSSDDPKRNDLARHGSLHPHPEDVTDPLFADKPFFDSRDGVQVKYEMLRSVHVEGRSVSNATRSFGFSRPTFYEAQIAFEQRGLPGLLPARKGPRRAHKLSEPVMAFVDRLLEAEPRLGAAALAERIHTRFNVSVHPRSITRALQRRRAKKNRHKR